MVFQLRVNFWLVIVRCKRDRFGVQFFVSYCSIVKSENIEELVNLITTEPSEESEERVRYKYIFYFIVKFLYSDLYSTKMNCYIWRHFFAT